MIYLCTNYINYRYTISAATTSSFGQKSYYINNFDGHSIKNILSKTFFLRKKNEQIYIILIIQYPYTLYTIYIHRDINNGASSLSSTAIFLVDLQALLFRTLSDQLFHPCTIYRVTNIVLVKKENFNSY